MPRPNPQHKTPAPPGFVYVVEASRLSGRTIETLYKDRSIQRRTGHSFGPPSKTLNGKAVWRIADIEAWRDAAPYVEPDAEQVNDSRPPEPRLSKAA